MDPLETRLIEIEKKIDAMQKMVKRLYIIFLVGVIVTAVTFIIPLIAALFIVPSFLSSYSSMLAI